MAASRTIPRNAAGFSWVQVCLLRDATTNMSAPEAEEFLGKVLRILDAWDKAPPRADTNIVKKAIASVRALEGKKDPVQAAVHEIAEDAEAAA